MPCTVKIRVVEGRNLPVMDRASGSTDAYTEIIFADFPILRTEICRKSLDPVWNEDFRIEVADDRLLQDEPVQLKVKDSDVYSADDTIGICIIDLNPLLLSDGPMLISGWFPIYDTHRGVAGEIYLIVKLQFFDDINPFRESSAGVWFFCITSPPQSQCLQIETIYGFVEELLVEPDPEYHWRDAFRANRTSNEARQMLIYSACHKVRRQLGKKVLEMGANAVIAYREDIDLEGDVTDSICVRAYGTACFIIRPPVLSIPTPIPIQVPAQLGIGIADNRSPEDAKDRRRDRDLDGTTGSLSGFNGSKEREKDKEKDKDKVQDKEEEKEKEKEKEKDGEEKEIDSAIFSMLATRSPIPSFDVEETNEKQAKVPVENGPRESVSNVLEVPNTPSLSIQTDNLPANEYPEDGVSTTPEPMVQSKVFSFQTKIVQSSTVQLLTLRSFPTDVRMRLGGVVTARAVKLLSTKSVALEVRDAWWTEVRDEVRTHAHALRCGYVIGYRETVTIDGDLIVISASGTAASLNLPRSVAVPVDAMRDTMDDVSMDGSAVLPARRLRSRTRKPNRLRSMTNRPRKRPCSCCHIPYSPAAMPFPIKLVQCGICREKLVPEVLLTTIEPPDGLPVGGRGTMLEARVCRFKRRGAGESNATAVSEAIPFLEYDLHRQLLCKLKVQGMNAIFGLRLDITVGPALIIGIATATALYVPALPLPPPLAISRSLEIRDGLDVQFIEKQKQLEQLSEINLEQLRLAPTICVNNPALKHVTSTFSLPYYTPRLTPSVQGAKSLVVRRGRSHPMSTMTLPPPALSDEGLLAYSGAETPSRITDSPRSTYSASSSDSGSDSSDSETEDNELPTLSVDERPSFMIEVDDETDADLVATLLEPLLPDDMSFSNLEMVPGSSPLTGPMELITAVKRFEFDVSGRQVNEMFSAAIYEFYASLVFRLQLRGKAPSCLAGIRTTLHIHGEHTLELMLTAAVLMEPDRPFHVPLQNVPRLIPVLPAKFKKNLIDPAQVVTRLSLTDDNDIHGSSISSRRSSHSLLSATLPPGPSVTSRTVSQEEVQMFPVTAETPTQVTAEPTLPLSIESSRPVSLHPASEWPLLVGQTSTASVMSHASSPSHMYNVEITPLAYVPGHKIERYLGHISLHLIKESNDVRDENGVESFSELFIAETHALARAHVSSLGGNVLLGLRIATHYLVENKHQAYSLINLSGDVALMQKEPHQHVRF